MYQYRIRSMLACVVSLLALFAATLSGCGVPAQLGRQVAALKPAAAQAVTPGALTPVETAVAAPTALPVQSGPPPERPIYILDPNDQGILGRILVVDPDAGRVAFEIQTRMLPEATVSADGERLYVADSYRMQLLRGESRDVATVYDPRTGNVLVDDTAVKGRLLYKGFPAAGHPFLVLSADGRRLYVMKYGAPDVNVMRLQVLDAATLQTLHEGDLPSCGRLVQARPDGWLCVQGNIMLVDPYGKRAAETLVRLPNVDVAGAALADQGNTLYVMSPEGMVTRIDLTTRTAQSPAEIEMAPGWRLTGDMTLSSDGKRLFAGVDTGEDQNQYFTNAIAVYDTGSWERLATIKPHGWMIYFALSAAGDQLYLVSPSDQSLSIYDTATFKEVARLPNLGGTPTQVLVPPLPRP